MNYSPFKDEDIAVISTVANTDALGMSFGWMRQSCLKDSCFLGATDKHATKTAMVGLCDR
jgi:hypothetical protein